MSTIFMGKSRADELLWSDIPTSADPALRLINQYAAVEREKKNNQGVVGNPRYPAKRLCTVQNPRRAEVAESCPYTCPSTALFL